MSKDVSKEILKYINFNNGFYIECGANDGIFQSNTYRLEQEYGWSGLLIEPSILGFNKCLFNRGKNNIVLNYALVSDSYKSEFIVGDFMDGHPTASINGKIRKREVDSQIRARTLTSILDELKIKNIDFFSLDVEGYEYEVLNGLDFNKYIPKYILLEFNIGEEIVFDFIKSKGYENLGCLSDFNYTDDPYWPGTHNDYLFKAKL